LTAVDAELVRRVNEAYHDAEGRAYEDAHPEIFEAEGRRWKAFGALCVRDRRGPLRFLDIGSGTGFVALQLAPFLREGDVFVCADVSAVMLEVCRKNVLAGKFACGFEFVKLEGDLPGAAESVDVVTMNSVVHHVPDHAALFGQVSRLLKKGGRLIVAHEPNGAFYRSAFLRANALLTEPRLLAGAVSRWLGVHELLRKVWGRLRRKTAAHNRTVEEVNARLLREGVIRAPLTIDQVCRIVDFHVPALGGGGGRGIDLEALAAAHLPGFRRESFATYNHLGTEGGVRRMLRGYDALLARVFPLSGSTFAAVLRKG
jgi:SAM-dependent methyltransferase